MEVSIFILPEVIYFQYIIVVHQFTDQCSLESNITTDVDWINIKCNIDSSWFKLGGT